jgi:mRNA deadenylase 3'-5' endonuclease subunit Ccr4
MLENGEILIEEAFEAVTLSAFSNGFSDLRDYIFMETKAQKSELNKSIDMLMARHKMEQDPKKKQIIKQQIRELQEKLEDV